MKLKQFIIPVAGALLLGGCEADHRNDNLLDSVVYLLESDLQKALFYDIEETTDYSFRAFSSGYTVTPSELGIELSDDVLTAYNEANGTAYTALDPACYRLVNSTGSVDADHPSTTFTVQLDCSAIKQLGDLTSYVIPLRLTSSSSKVNEELGSILINPEMAETQVLVRNAGVVECDLGSSQTLDFTAYVEFDNKWETTTEYVYGDEVLDAYNAEVNRQLLNGQDVSAYADSLLEETLQQVVEEKVKYAKAEELGLTALSAEDEAAIDAAAQERYEQDLAFYIINDGTKTEDEAREEAVARMEADGTTLETCRADMESDWWEEKLRDYAAQSVTVTEEAVQEVYDRYLSEQQAAYDASPEQ